MPLLHGKPFVPNPIPTDLRPDEEIFVCSLTNEVFRNYDDYFNRQYLCNTANWSCELTGQHNLTYEQAVESEREARASLHLLSDSLKRAILIFLHNPTLASSNMRVVVDTVTLYFKERFVINEELDYFPSLQDKKHIKKVKVINVTKSTPDISPVKDSVQSTASTDNITDKDTTITTNTFISTPTSTSKSTSKLSIVLDQEPHPSLYMYTVAPYSPNEAVNYVTTCDHLSRPKHCLTKEKVKLFLKNALYRDDKHILQIKLEYIEKYQLSVPLNATPSHSTYSQLNTSTSTPQKRSLSQSSLDSFFLTPNDPKKPKMALSTLSSSGIKKSNKSPQKTPRRKSRSSLSTSAKKNKDNSTSKTPTSIGAKKVLKKAKQLKQLDLRKNLVKKKGGDELSERELLDLKKKSNSSKKRRESELERLKQARLNRQKEQRERKKLERLKAKEWLKPREDTLCEDSKPLPSFEPVVAILYPELFGDTVMFLEFLYHYGSLFNLKDAIHANITFEKLEEALVSNHPDTILYGIIKSLLQTIFATMEEEHEAIVELDKKKRNSAERTEQDNEGQIETTSRTESRRSSVGSIPVEGIDEVEERSRDNRLASLKLSAAMYTKWPHITQSSSLFQLAFDPYTVSEILRLHLLSCGGYSNGGERTWFRFCNRGGYVDSDDPVLEFRLRHSHIIDALGSSSIYDLSPSYKLKILSVLSLQMLMFSTSREFMEETLKEGKKIRKEIRLLQFSLSEKKKKDKNKEESKQETTPASTDQKEKKTKGSAPLIKEVVEDKVETKEERRQRINEEICDLERQLYPVTATTNLQPLGLDRYMNKYWVFPSVNGLFVELSEEQQLKQQEEIDDKASATTADCKLSEALEENVVEDSSTLVMNTNQLTPATITISSHESMNTVNTPNESDPAINSHNLTTSQDNVDHINGNAETPSSFNSSNNLSVPTNPAAAKFKRSLSPVIRLSKISTTSNSHISHGNTTSNLASSKPHYIASNSNSKWGVYSSKEQIEILIDALNTRGEREVKLKGSLQKLLPVFDNVSNCPVFVSYTSQRWSMGPLESTADEYLELYLREQLLDLEEKIWMGNLGAIKDVKDRLKWRESIESSGAAGKLKEDSPVVNGCSSKDSDSDSVSLHNPVHELAKALLGIQGGIEKKYLLPPLGTGVDLKLKGKKLKENGVVKKDDICVEDWKVSLLKTTSFSQIFVHLSTLERSVAWSKSLMNVRCRICRRKGGDEYMLLCDGCDHGYHTYCLRPPVYDIPEEDWFCYNCCPVTPVKRRRAAVANVSSLREASDSESENSEKDEEYGEEVEEEMEEDAEEEEDSESEEVTVGRRNLRQSTIVQRSAVAAFNARSLRSTRQAKSGRDTSPILEISRRRKKKNMSETDSHHSSKKRLKLDDVSSVASSSYSDRAESIISSIIDVKCSKVQGPAQLKAQKTLEHQLSKALLEELMSHSDSWPFLNAVRRREFPDYHEIVSQPMDFKTIRQKVSSHRYTNLDQFLCDVDLILSNCSLYYKRHTKEAKAGNSLKKYLNHRCADLGLRNLSVNCKSVSSRSTGIQLRSSCS